MSLPVVDLEMSVPSNTPKKVPVLRLSGENTPSEYLFDAWRMAASALFAVEPLKHPKSYLCACSCYAVDQLLYFHSIFDDMEFVRSSRQLAGGASDYFLLQYYQKGQLQGHLDNGLPLTLKHDSIILQDLAHAYSCMGGSTHSFAICIPRHLILAREKIYTQAPILSFPLSSPQGKVLHNAWQTILKQLPQITLAEAIPITRGFVGLLNGLLSADWDEVTCQQVQQATLKAMQNYIRDHLQDPGLGIDQLCQRFHCSRASVYRFFKPLGGVKSYIQSQRLNGCFNDLRHLGSASSTQNADIAARWGFTNMTYFYRLFKQQFAMTPSEARALFEVAPPLLQSSPMQMSDAKRLKQWLEGY